MIKVIGVRFRKAGKVYYFDPAQMEIKMGDHVIVETARGIEFGEVVLGVREVDEKKVIQPLMLCSIIARNSTTMTSYSMGRLISRNRITTIVVDIMYNPLISRLE